jgi:hypothetical protein
MKKHRGTFFQSITGFYDDNEIEDQYAIERLSVMIAITKASANGDLQLAWPQLHPWNIWWLKQQGFDIKTTENNDELTISWPQNAEYETCGLCAEKITSVVENCSECEKKFCYDCFPQHQKNKN